MKKERFRVMVAAHLLLKNENKVLLSLRQNTGHRDGEYGLVAGHVEEGESIQDCMIREAKEEADIVLSTEDIHFFHIFDRTWKEYVNFCFVAEKWEGEIKNMEPGKCADLSWFNMDQLPENTIPYVKDLVQAYKKGQYFSDTHRD